MGSANLWVGDYKTRSWDVLALVDFIDPSGYWGVGAVLSETTEAGVGAAGARQTGSVGLGYFQQNGLYPHKSDVGAFGTWGGFENNGISPHAYPGLPNCSQPSHIAGFE